MLLTTKRLLDIIGEVAEEIAAEATPYEIFHLQKQVIDKILKKAEQWTGLKLPAGAFEEGGSHEESTKN